ncbi:site-specific integrase [Nocardia amamiensis]|nr:site-specific integrase [Nocardia amamiensis]
MTALATADLNISPFTGTDICRQAGFDLPTDATGPVFDHDIWDFKKIIGLPIQMPICIRQLDFTLITEPRWRLVAKELMFAFLVPHHPRVGVLANAYRSPLTLQTCHRRLRELTGWLNWLTSRGISTLTTVTESDCTDYLNSRRTATTPGRPPRAVSRSQLRAIVMSVLDLAHYGELFTADRYPPDLRLWHGATAAAVAGDRSTLENKTPPIAREILHPLLAASLFLIEVLSPHIRRLREQITSTDNQHGNTVVPGHYPPAAAFAAALRWHQTTGEPLRELGSGQVTMRLDRGWDREDPLLPVSFAALAQQSGRTEFNPDRITPELRVLAEETVRMVGLTKPWARDEPAIARADTGEPVVWTPPLHLREVQDLIETLRTACFTVTAAVTGMRSSELMESRVGCRRTPEQIRPGMFRYRLTSKVIKGKPHGGIDDEWVVTEEVFRAIELAEQLCTTSHPGDPLFGRLGFTMRYKSMRAWVNGPAGQRLGLTAIPDGPVNLRMLRRRLAIELAYRPGGLLAAKLHLKHALVAATEGYSARPGGSQAKLLAEINSHEQQRNLELVLTEFRNFQNGIMPSGPGARELIDSFRSVDDALTEHARSAPKLLASDQELRNLLTKRARVLHLGTSNFCWFADPSRALCLRMAGTPTADNRCSDCVIQPAAHKPPTTPATDRSGQPPPTTPATSSSPSGRPARTKRLVCKPISTAQPASSTRSTPTPPPARTPLMAITDEQRLRTEHRICTAIDRLLRGDIPPGGSCDIKTLATKSGVSRAALYRTYAHLREEFEHRRDRIRDQGERPDPRDVQIERLKAEITKLKDRLTQANSTIEELADLRGRALSQLAAQHDEILRLRSTAPPNLTRLPAARAKVIGPC